MANSQEMNELLRCMIEKLREDMDGTSANEIPVGVSNRHIHLSKEDLETLFGESYELTAIKELSQPGQYAAKETLLISGPKGSIEKVRILGPVRPQSQVEILQSDCFKLGVKAPVRMSGDLAGSAPITLIGPRASIFLKEGAIVAKRHIHMTKEDALRFSVQDGDVVSVEVKGERGGVLSNVAIRVTDASKLDFHVDTEEANALGLNSNSKVVIIK